MCLAVFFFFAGAGGCALGAGDPFEAYVKAPDDAYGFRLEKEETLGGGVSAYVLALTSQTWKGITWKHALTVLRPKEVAHPGHALLFISGGSNRDLPPRRPSSESPALARIAGETGTVVAALHQVPNQPLFDGLSEDALIAYTFEKYFETKDPTWPCLLPMTKSAVRAMDAVQSFARASFGEEIRHFVVTGASKRGWTTWLTGASDPRVVAIAPMVIDVINVEEQLPHQKKSFGGYSEMIHDYTDRGLPDRLADPTGRALLELVDPYRRKDKLAMPKLVVLGTLDPYWPVDAAKLYFGALDGEKFLHYVPNVGHDAWPSAAPSVAAFYHLVVAGKPRPRFRWTSQRADGGATLRIEAEDKPDRVELWRAASATRDFRKATWRSSPLRAEGGRYSASIARPEAGFVAFFARLSYRSELGVDFLLATNVEVLGD